MIIKIIAIIIMFKIGMIIGYKLGISYHCRECDYLKTDYDYNLAKDKENEDGNDN